ncbi:helix-turn-helix transcriptional regulator [Microbacterium trichothecenolyticum]|uniref:Helix-turn-helix transcriptional regulator n=1 Tax=Microbacterium ureisolvens TaxID=2781186 RepID=A0ABS7I1B9_9MICO|nr:MULTISPECIES: LuxR C-terminal-related transcriptional regulator [Microbacterium]MBW9111444.1 helix-turn-helix transcriptional regulator [Microbacterium ureisolvens]MBW9121692.1 helix-turn-helix transcriptional regulator [Microbacterium trichothecenolyticum]
MTDSLSRTVASRRAAADHARALAEQRDRYALTLESLLATLRSPRLDDRAARTMALDVAAGALVGLRVQTDQQSAALEPVAGAFERLRSDLRPLVRYSDLDVQFVEPPLNGRALPGDIAHAARAIVRTAVLAIVDRGETTRARIQWDCDGLHLLIAIRDDGRGELTLHDDTLRPVAEQVAAHGGHLTVASTPGWGSEIGIRLPLDPPTEPGDLPDAVDASPRERDVLRLVVAGRRNRDIAQTLGVSENTVKFHVSNLLRKSGASSRTELVALARG